MAEELIVGGESKKERYSTLLPQVEALINHESDPVANMANISSAIMETFGFLWVGFYRVVGNEVVLGPFQGPLACPRIKYGRGVCGTAWEESRTLVVDDVESFPGHIACSSASRSEIVVPYFSGGKVAGVLDIDSSELATFDEVDAEYLEKMMQAFGDSLF